MCIISWSVFSNIYKSTLICFSADIFNISRNFLKNLIIDIPTISNIFILEHHCSFLLFKRIG